MNMSLYEVTADYQKSLKDIEDMLEGGELSTEDKHELIENSLICLSDQFDVKALNVAAYIAYAELSVTAIKTVETRMVQRRKSMESKVKSLKQYLLDQMFYMDKKAISNDSMAINVRQNPCRVIVEDQNLIPLKYQNKETVFTVIKSAIADELKNGKNIAELINNLASVALKLLIIGLLIVIEQWVENY